MMWGVIDLETTGFNQEIDEICEIALILVKDTKILDIYHHFFQVKKVNPGAEAVNGLSMEKLTGWELIKDELYEIQKLIPNKLFAHNSQFDSRFLIKNKIVKQDQRFVDTLKLCKRDGINLENNKLITWLKHYGIRHRPHGALSDCLGLYQLITLKGWQIL